MSRLVDADELIKNIKSYTGVFNNEGYYTRNDLIVKAINKTPTAYDVEAVVRVLEKQKIDLDQPNVVAYANAKGWNQAISLCIEIVKRGGRNE